MRFLPGLGAGAGIDADQDMACLPRLLDLVLRAMSFVILLDFSRGGLDLGRQGFRRQRHVFDARLLGYPELLLVPRRRVLLCGIGFQLHLRQEFIGRDHELADFTLLLAEAQQPPDDGCVE